MNEPRDPGKAQMPFLSVEDAEIVHGPDVIADKVSGALKDADRFDLPHVKPPLSEALAKVSDPSSRRADPAGGPPAQDALSGETAAVDDKAGSAELLEPGADARAS